MGESFIPADRTHGQKLDKILSELHFLAKRMEKKMTVDKATFDAALATLVTNFATLETNLATIDTNVGNINKALAQFIADYNAKTGVDLTNELASVTSLANSTAADAASASTSAASLSTDLSNVTAADPNA